MHWVLMSMGAIVSTLVQTQVTYAGQVPEQIIFNDLLQDVNHKLLESSEARSCSGVQITLSCGNGICQRNKGENEVTCPLDCIDAYVKSYNSQTFCREIKELSFPQSAEEVQAIVRQAISDGRRVKALGRAHSTSGLICSNGVVIVMENLNKIVGLEKNSLGQEFVNLEPGVNIEQLTEWLHSRGRSLGVALAGFRGLSIGGAIATGVHGSSIKNTAVISSLVEAVSLIDGHGERREFDRSSSDQKFFKAVTANLGMLGVVVQLKLRVQRQFNLRIHTSYDDDFTLFGKKGLEKEISSCDYGLISWFPHSRKMMKICGVKTAEKEHLGAQNVLLNPFVPQFIIDPYKVVLHYGACFSGLNCMIEDLRYATLRLFPPFQFKNDLGYPFYTYDLVGPSHRMITSSLTRSQKEVLETDWEIAVPMSKAQKALEYMQRFLAQNKVCLPLLGVLIRFAPADDASLLAHTVAQGEFKKSEPAVLFEIPSYQPTGFNEDQLSSYQRPFEEFAQTLIRDFSGRAHWGKNSDSIFKYQKQFNRYGENLTQFENVRKELDPEGRFKNSFSEWVAPDSK